WAGSTSNKISIRLFLDGLDEVPDREQQRRIIELLREGLDRYPALTITVTSRPYIWGTWLNWMPRFHIAELTGRDQRKLAANWLEDDEQVAKFFKQLEQSPALQKLMGTPLLATLILNLYRRTPRIPENKASLYRAFVDLYCGGWDTAKGGFQRGQYHTEQKLRPLAALAYRMHLSNTPECSEQMFMQAVRATMPRFVEKGADFLTEVVQDGILVRAGRDLLFSHLSFQEYLAAQYLASDPTGERARRALRLFLEGEDWWKEVVEFFIISRDDPAAVSDWISRTARATLGRGGAESADLRRRLQLLAISVEETFPGYKPSFDLFRRWSRDD
ncbi:MAG TPA: hypothetical protein VFU49_11945, partial [Ktedonobacteraceae bacterium]|nr:hypothetical protein [Ktedonobacteraceae bacterium]